jgi:hypothetical protein
MLQLTNKILYNFNTICGLLKLRPMETVVRIVLIVLMPYRKLVVSVGTSILTVFSSNNFFHETVDVYKGYAQIVWKFNV